MLRALLNVALEPLSAAVAATSVAIPTEEIDALIVAVTVAVFLANRGRAADGYTCLLAGLRRVESEQGSDAVWGPELLSRYRDVMGNYARHYGVAVE